MTSKFEVGTVYKTRSICDYDCIFEWRVVGRSEKTITVQDMSGIDNGRTRRCKVYVNEQDGVEMAWPNGHYSFAPIIRATRMVA